MLGMGSRPTDTTVFPDAMENMMDQTPVTTVTEAAGTAVPEAETASHSRESSAEQVVSAKASGLTESDIAALADGCAKLPGTWAVEFEREEDDCVYARLAAPWLQDLSSSFLVDRVGEVVVLTDRMSSLTDDLASWHPSVRDALEAIQSIVFGQARQARVDAGARLAVASD